MLPGLQMTAPTDSLEIVKFGRQSIKKNKYLAEEVEMLQQTVTDEKALQDIVKKESTRLRS